jgi:hypothetical protein
MSDLRISHIESEVHTFAAQHIECFRCAWELVLARPKHAYPSRIISLLIPFFLVFRSRKSKVGLVEQDMRTIAVEEEYLVEDVSTLAYIDVPSVQQLTSN